MDEGKILALFCGEGRDRGVHVTSIDSTGPESQGGPDEYPPPRRIECCRTL
jgi:hypothetical protein